MTTLRTHARYGWIPDLPDQRDHLYAAPLDAALPHSVNLEAHCPAIYDQGQLGSCTANAIGAAVQFDRMRQKLTPDFVPSRLFIYYNERVIEGTVDSDSGAMLRDGIKAVAQWGAPDEAEWPYDIAKFADAPPSQVFADALPDKALKYARVSQTPTQMKGCLAAGNPFVIGFTVYESFESQAVASSGIVPMPGHGEAVLGGHAVLVVGYDDTRRRFRCRNSWGVGWGQAGYFEMPYGYLTNRHLSSDFWTVSLVGS